MTQSNHNIYHLSSWCEVLVDETVDQFFLKGEVDDSVEIFYWCSWFFGTMGSGGTTFVKMVLTLLIELVEIFQTI